MNKCINCGRFLNCEYASQDIEECKSFTKSKCIPYID